MRGGRNSAAPATADLGVLHDCGRRQITCRGFWAGHRAGCFRRRAGHRWRQAGAAGRVLVLRRDRDGPGGHRRAALASQCLERLALCRHAGRHLVVVPPAGRPGLLGLAGQARLSLPAGPGLLAAAGGALAGARPAFQPRRPCHHGFFPAGIRHPGHGGRTARRSRQSAGDPAGRAGSRPIGAGRWRMAGRPARQAFFPADPGRPRQCGRPAGGLELPGR